MVERKKLTPEKRLSAYGSTRDLKHSSIYDSQAGIYLSTAHSQAHGVSSMASQAVGHGVSMASAFALPNVPSSETIDKADSSKKAKEPSYKR